MDPQDIRSRLSTSLDTSVRFVSAEELQSADLMEECISAIENRLAHGWDVSEPPRGIHQVGNGQLLLMPGWDTANLVVKVNTILPDGDSRSRPRVQGIFVIFELPGMAPVMVVDAAGLTALRTPAVSAVATRYLARPDASRLVVFGTGPQAVGHIEAMRLVRNISTVGIVSRRPESAERLADDLCHSGIDAVAVSADAVVDADLVCTCTTSRTPVFDGSLLPDGTHVNAIGSHESTVRELDDATFVGASVIVDSVEMALSEAGDVIMALRAGVLPNAASLTPLSAIVRSEVPIAEAKRTIFKSVGTAGQDLVAGELLLKLLGAYR
jgi:ornithine cyclodeaminase/alanine dehydrogenase-like protein (mu-crystallin family)